MYPTQKSAGLFTPVIKVKLELDEAVHACNPVFWGAEARGSLV